MNDCVTCSKPNPTLCCALCSATVCKSCAHFVGEEDVTLMEPKPSYYESGVFCQSCFDEKIATEVTQYNELAAQAGQVNVFYKSESKESRFIRRTEKPIRVEGCADAEEVVMKLAFAAAQMGFNILLDVETSFEKVHNGRWQTSVWKGVAIPGQVDEGKLNRRFIGAPN